MVEHEAMLNQLAASVTRLVNSLDDLEETRTAHQETDRLMTQWFLDNGFPEVADARNQVQARCGTFLYD